MVSGDPPRTSWVTWVGLAVVLVAAAVLSFAALRDLAIAVRIPPSLAALLPIAVDAGAGVSCGAWLSRRTRPDAARFARSMTWGLLGLTVAGNAAAQGMAAAAAQPPWWAAVLVGAIPPAVVGGVVHLAVLVGRDPLAVTGPVTDDVPQPEVDVTAGPGRDPDPAGAVTGVTDELPIPVDAPPEERRRIQATNRQRRRRAAKAAA